MAARAGVFINVIGDADLAAFQRAQKELDSLRKGAEKASGGVAQGFIRAGDAMIGTGRKMSSVGDNMTRKVTLPLIAAGAGALKMSGDFNKGMGNIATLIPGNTQRVAELKDGILELAPAVGKTTADLTDGMYQVISAFGDTSDSLSILDINARAATAGMATTTDAINLTSAVTKGYGDTSAEAVQKASDLALLTVRLGQTTFPELAGSIGKVIPLAQELGVTQEEVFASMATFTGVTGQAAEVSTQLRGAMQSLLSPTVDARKAIEAAGFANGAAAVKSLGMEGAIGLLSDAAKKSGEPLQKFVGSVEGQTIALGLAGAQSDDYATKLAAMGDAAGATDAAFAEVAEGAGKQAFTLSQLRAEAEVAAIRLGDGLAPALAIVLDHARPLITKITELATAFTNADPGTQKLVLGLVGVVAAIGPALSVIGRVITMMGHFTKAIGFVIKGMAVLTKVMMANPWILLVAALIVVAVLIYKHWDKISAFLVKVWNWIKDTAGAIWGGIRDFFVGVFKFLEKIFLNFTPAGQIIKNWDKIKAAAQAIWGFISAVVSRVWNDIKTVITTAINIVRTVITTYLNIIKAVWSAMWGTFGGLIKAVFGLIVAVIRLQLAVIMLVIGAFLKGVQVIWSAVWNGIKAVAKAVWSAIAAVVTTYVNIVKAVITTVFNAIKKTVSTIMNAIRAVIAAVWAVIGGTVMSVVNTIRGHVTSAFNAVRSIVTSVVNAVRSVITSGFNGARTAATTAFNGIKTAVTNAISGLVSTVSGVVSRVKGVFSGAASWLYNAGKDIIQGLIDGVTNMIGKLTDKLNGITDMIPDIKGPPAKDAQLLRKNGELIMQGLIGGIDGQVPALRRTLGGVTSTISSTAFAGLNMGITPGPLARRSGMAMAGGVTVAPGAVQISIGANAGVTRGDVETVVHGAFVRLAREIAAR